MTIDDKWLARRKKEQHGRTRIMERFGMNLTDDEISAIKYEIEEYINYPVNINEDNGRSFHHFVIRGVSMVLLYDWEYSCILTAYRKKWFDNSDPKSWTFKPRKRKRKNRKRVFDSGKRPVKPPRGYNED